MEGLAVGVSLELIEQRYDGIVLFWDRQTILVSQQRQHFADLRDHLREMATIPTQGNQQEATESIGVDEQNVLEQILDGQ